MSVDLTFLKQVVRGQVLEDDAARDARSTDASIFRVKPAAIFVPEDAQDLMHAVQAVNSAKQQGINVSLTARAGGTCMSGGSLTESIQVDCAKLNLIEYRGGDSVTTQPGAFFRDVDAKTTAKGWFFPSYPASRLICAIGGMVGNNAGGEKNLSYGKTNKYVSSIDVVLDDGSFATLRKLNESELAVKLALRNREGEIYRHFHKLIMDNEALIRDGRPRVTKNSSGYNLWDVWDPAAKTFDLTQVVVGSQGTLCMISGVTLRLVKPRPYAKLVVLMLKDETRIATLVKDLLAFEPESLECYDSLTLRLAMRFLPGLARHMGIGFISTLLRFVPDFIDAFFHGLPPLAVLVQITSDDENELKARTDKLTAMLDAQDIRYRVARTDAEASKYWAIRRESFSLLRERMKDKIAAPFIDDLVVRAEDLSEFMPQLEKLMKKYAPKMAYTIAGHVGDGNFHIFPILNLRDPDARTAMYELLDEALELTLSFGGSTSGEHNDGLIRTRYVERQFGSSLYRLFEETKDIWDPSGIFNPGKKVRGDWAYAQQHVK